MISAAGHTTFATRFIAIILIAAFGLQMGAILLVPRTAEASVPEHCSILDLNCIKEYLIDLALRIVARVLYDQLVDMLFAWISNAGGSGVGYMLNYEQILRSVIDQRGAQYITNLGMIGLPPELLDYSQTLLREPRSLLTRAGFNAQPYVPNLAAFYQGELTNWNSYAVMMLEPRNNPQGLAPILIDDKLAREGEIMEATIQNAGNNEGYLGVLRQVLDCDGPDCWSQLEAITPGTLIGDTLSKLELTDFDWVVNSDEISELIVAIAAMYISQAISNAIYN